MSWLHKAGHWPKPSSGQAWDIEDYQVDKWVRHFKERIIKEANLESITALPEQERKQTIERLVYQMIEEERVIMPSQQINQIIEQIINESVGYGPLEALLKQDDITEIMVNGPREVYIERQGKLEKTNVRFKDKEHIRHIIDRMIAPIGRRIDESSPMVDARLPDGSRVNAAIPPVSIDGPVISIRKFNKDPFTMEDLISFGTFTEQMGEFLSAAVQSKCNMLVSGGTGSGKTTLLNVLSASIPPGERIITIEDMAELRFNYDNIVRMEARPANMEGKGEISIRHLVKNALRMRPDRIIVGEVRGSEALDMLQAMNTGHEGSLTTVHANSPKDALGRLEAMVIMSGLSITVDVIREYFVGAIDIIVQTQRLPDGTRKITSIAEVVGEDGKVSINEIFRFHRTGTTPQGDVQGYFEATGYVPQVFEKIRTTGIRLPEGLFHKGELVWA
ncbi:pilus assembly protein CpaF [Caldalkalibacillus uzonensis]|uniref:Pilus assembly protein CpaF n=1 Tax=Caldalkalibacillus uzonensis TaxID=353224 RepID=A0ABU0CP62_9BACI|nr:CpaF family protein [Caldalkalibacillus uzonensis]MDQ0337878.1 pilus assembly protein CpaF [Caldalkalibacillus uzonensis]